MKMMNARPAQLGLFLALLSLLSGTSPVASQEVSCETSDDCPDDTYCSNGSICLDVGACTELDDCVNPSNSPYPVALCLGTTVCGEGFCGVDCAEIPPDDKPPIDDKGPDNGVQCAKNSDCDGQRGDHYCASDGICEPMGGCAVPGDCLNDANWGFPIAMCIGSMMCDKRTCGMDCSGGSDAIFLCDTSDDCSEPESYCTVNGHCRKHGTCDIVDDCSVFDNTYMMIECVGRLYCEGWQCGIACGEVPVDSNPAVKCGTSQDCDGDDYCAGNGLCLPAGSCDRVNDCSDPDNLFMMAACVGPITCESAMCAKSCDSSEPELSSCFTNDDCGFEEYCAGNGMCYPSGACDQVKDCSNLDNFFITPACVGTMSCDSDTCSKTCDSADADTTENGSPVVVDVATCSSDSDCLTVATERSLISLYCAQGVCMEHGKCLSDSDCLNPSNVLWSDKKCFGYLHCDEAGSCDRVCGQDCKNGSRVAQCFVNPCDVETMCEGAVSCRMTTCDEECKAMHFDAAGEVVEFCKIIEIGTKANADVDMEPKRPDSETNNLEDGSSVGTIRSTVFALLAAVLVASAAVIV